MSDEIVVERINIPNFDWISGKVRDRAKIDKALNLLVFVTTDRISAFDAVSPTPIPGKGVVLNQLSNFWKSLCERLIGNDVCSWDHKSFLAYLDPEQQKQWEPVLNGRTIVVTEADRIPAEFVVRGYLYGSYWEEYLKARGEKQVSHDVAVYGHRLPGNLVLAQEIPMPIFTPSTKAESGHDQNLDEEQLFYLLQNWIAASPSRRRSMNARITCQALKGISLTIYWFARDYARRRGIIIADTKFEFGIIDGSIILIDELLTPDSSRFWPVDSYQPGMSQPSFDKQPVRDWLEKSGWNKEPPAPVLSQEVVQATTERYRKAFEMLTGRKL